MSPLRLASVLALSIVLTVVGTTGTAVAQSSPSVAPPGNSAVDQYRESLPPASSNTRKLGRKDRSGLERQGRDGAALAAVLERSGGVPRAAASSSASGATSESGRATSPRRSSGSQTSNDADAAEDGAAADAPRDAVDSRPIAPAAASSTVGPVPVWAMLAAAVVLVGVGLAVRVRKTS